MSKLEHPDFTAEAVQLVFADDSINLQLDRLNVDENQFKNLSLNCQALMLDGEHLRCLGGGVSIPDWLENATFSATLNTLTRNLNGRLSSSRGESLEVSFRTNNQFDIHFTGWSIAHLSRHFDFLNVYQPQALLTGRASGQWDEAGANLTFESSVRDGRFSSESGLQAAEGLSLSVEGSLKQLSPSAWRIASTLNWSQGEAYIHPLYFKAGLKAEFNAELHGNSLQVDHASARIEGFDVLQMRGVIGLSPLSLASIDLTVSDVDLAVLSELYLLPLLVPALTERLKMTGTAQAAVKVRDNQWHSLSLTLSGAKLSLDNERFEVGPVEASLPWRRNSDSKIKMDVAGARWESIGLGQFQVNADISAEKARFDMVSIPVLDGRLLISDLNLEWREDGLHGSGDVVLEPVSMQALTAALELPLMSGVISAGLPGLTVSPGSLVLNGSLVASLFNGYLQIDRLEIREPFGLASYLNADIKATHLDLEQITSTFAFGSITGFVDAEILGLELVRWRPVAFDARVRSSPGRYTKRISQRAVQNIGSLSGGGAGLALQRGVLGFFDSFGYRELGLSCLLKANECLMGGVEDQKSVDGSVRGFVIVRGGGIPSLNVIGYNRRVNWHDLLERLRAAIESNEAPLVE